VKESNKANVNDPVFISLSKGLWGGTVFGYEVVYERLTHNYWTCRVSDGIDTGKLLAAAGTRSKALIEAYKNVLNAEQKLRIRQFYKIRKDHVSGRGFFLVKFNSEGIYDSGHGPYPTAGEAYEMILELEGVEIPEQS
jgi:hypothetical protein